MIYSFSFDEWIALIIANPGLCGLQSGNDELYICTDEKGKDLLTQNIYNKEYPEVYELLSVWIKSRKESSKYKYWFTEEEYAKITNLVTLSMEEIINKI